MLHGEKFVKDYIVSIGSPPLAVSAVTRTEVLVGAQKEQMSLLELIEYLDLFDCLSVTKEVADCAAKLYANKPTLKFKDLIIAATAIVYNMILITSDQDFKNIPQLEIVTP